MILNDHFKLMRFTCVITYFTRVKKQESEFQYDVIKFPRMTVIFYTVNLRFSI